MSSRAARVSRNAVEPFTWGGPASGPAPVGQALPWAAVHEVVHEPAPPAAPDAAAVERDAFAKGYAQGERAGTEAGAARAEAMLRRLAETLDELQRLRGDLVRRTEREVVDLALAVARKILHREATIDRDLLMAMARVALDRLSDATAASIRLHPDDYATAMSGRGPGVGVPHGVQILADPSVRRGGCVVRSDVGSVDVGMAAQLDEITRTLLGDDAGPAAGLRDDAAA